MQPVESTEEKSQFLDLLVDCQLSEDVSRVFRARWDDTTLLWIVDYVDRHESADEDDDEFVVQGRRA